MARTLPSLENYTVNALNQYTAVPSLGASLSYDTDGNATSYPLPNDATNSAQLIWDVENRLVAITRADSSVVYASYDAQSRRISKQLDSTSATYYLYDGWNMIAEYTIPNSNMDPNTSILIGNTYTWGMDLSGSMQGAGGVGGLLAVTENGSSSTAHFYPTYDGNGNVSEYLDANGSAVAHYEYDTFGNEIVSATTGSLAQNFEYRFSTKYLDEESGFYYYGYRYYDPVTGRWLNRDPLQEDGGLNLYGFVNNNGINKRDYLGLTDCPEGEKCCDGDCVVPPFAHNEIDRDCVSRCNDFWADWGTASENELWEAHDGAMQELDQKFNCGQYSGYKRWICERAKNGAQAGVFASTSVIQVYIIAQMAMGNATCIDRCTCRERDGCCEESLYELGQAPSITGMARGIGQAVADGVEIWLAPIRDLLN